MTEREPDHFAVGVQRADTVGARSGKEVAEPLSGIVGTPRFVPRRRVERVDVEGDTSIERVACQGGNHARTMSRCPVPRVPISAQSDDSDAAIRTDGRSPADVRLAVARTARPSPDEVPQVGRPGLAPLSRHLWEWGPGLLGGGRWSGLSEVPGVASYGGACSVDGSSARPSRMPQFRMYCALACNHADSQIQS